MRTFRFELKWESSDRSEEIALGDRIIQIHRMKNAQKEVEAAYFKADDIIQSEAGYEHGQLTTIVIWDNAKRSEPVAIVSINGNEETFQALPSYTELDVLMASSMMFVAQEITLALTR